MNWRRVAEMLGFRHAIELQDRRSTNAKRLTKLDAEVKQADKRIHEITRESRLGSYRRVSIGPR